MQEAWVWSLGQEDPPEEGTATHSSILAWRIPWTEEPGRLQSMGSQRVRYDWDNSAPMHTHVHTYLFEQLNKHNIYPQSITKWCFMLQKGRIWDPEPLFCKIHYKFAKPNFGRSGSLCREARWCRAEIPPKVGSGFAGRRWDQCGQRLNASQRQRVPGRGDRQVRETTWDPRPCDSCNWLSNWHSGTPLHKMTLLSKSSLLRKGLLQDAA